MTGIVSGCRLGASHAIGHILGGSANVPHGYTSCVMLPHVLEWNASVNAERQKALALAMGKPNIIASDLIGKLIEDLQLPTKLKHVGVEKDQFETLSRNCMLDDWTFSNPKKIRSPDQITEILELAS